MIKSFVLNSSRVAAPAKIDKSFLVPYSRSLLLSIQAFSVVGVPEDAIFRCRIDFFYGGNKSDSYFETILLPFDTTNVSASFDSNRPIKLLGCDAFDRVRIRVECVGNNLDASFLLEGATLTVSGDPYSF